MTPKEYHPSGLARSVTLSASVRKVWIQESTREIIEIKSTSPYLLSRDEPWSNGCSRSSDPNRQCPHHWGYTASNSLSPSKSQDRVMDQTYNLAAKESGKYSTLASQPLEEDEHARNKAKSILKTSYPAPERHAGKPAILRTEPQVELTETIQRKWAHKGGRDCFLTREAVAGEEG